jgi:hypothetical protein
MTARAAQPASGRIEGKISGSEKRFGREKDSWRENSTYKRREFAGWKAAGGEMGRKDSRYKWRFGRKKDSRRETSTYKPGEFRN